MLMKLSGGALSFAVVRSVWLRLPPSLIVQPHAFFTHAPQWVDLQIPQAQLGMLRLGNRLVGFGGIGSLEAILIDLQRSDFGFEG